MLSLLILLRLDDIGQLISDEYIFAFWIDDLFFC